MEKISPGAVGEAVPEGSGALTDPVDASDDVFAGPDDAGNDPVGAGAVGADGGELEGREGASDGRGAPEGWRAPEGMGAPEGTAVPSVAGALGEVDGAGGDTEGVEVVDEEGDVEAAGMGAPGAVELTGGGSDEAVELGRLAPELLTAMIFST